MAGACHLPGFLLLLDLSEELTDICSEVSSGGRRIAELLILVGLGFLNPEEHLLVASLEFEMEDYAGGTELHFIRLKDEVILLHSPGGPDIPLEVHQLVSIPFLVSGLTILVMVLKFILPALISPRDFHKLG